MNPVDAAHRCAEWWPIEATIAPHSGWPVCIEATKLVIAAFERAGLGTLTPLPCTLVTMNAAACRVYETGEPESGSCRIEVGPRVQDKRTSDPAGTGWWGHLIAEHDEFLLDVVYHGVIRSCGGTDFGELGAFCATKGRETHLVDGRWHALTEDGVYICYQPEPDLAGWQDSPAWTAPLDDSVVTDLADLLLDR